MTAPTLDDLHDESTWLELRAQALPPQTVTDLVTTEQDRAEFIEGARLLRLDQGGKTVKPHQLLVVDMLAADHEENAVLVPRRSAKTTTNLALILGRCTLREDYSAAFTLTTTATKTSQMMRSEVFGPIERAYPDEHDRPMKLLRGKGDEHLRWANGSRFRALTPNGDSFRSDAFDFVLIDEAGEATVEQGEDISGAVLPTFDTRPGAQAVYAGTAGKYRGGLLLWDALHAPSNGMLAWWITDETLEDELAAWEPDDEHPFGRVRELVLSTHPGVASGLTTLEKVRSRFERLGPERFAREYLGVFGQVGEGKGILTATRWAEQGEAGTPVVPDRFALAAMPSFTQSAASVVAAWRDEQGRACGYLLDHKAGTTWLAEAAAKRARKHDRPIIYDSASSPMRVEVEAMRRMTPRPKLAPQTFRDITAAAALLVREVNGGNARHWRQPAMDEAAKVAVRRPAGANGWALGRPKVAKGDDEPDISPLEAWAMALRWYDENPARESVGTFTA